MAEDKELDENLDESEDCPYFHTFSKLKEM